MALFNYLTTYLVVVEIDIYFKLYAWTRPYEMVKLGHNTNKWKIKIFLTFILKTSEFWSEKHEKNNYHKCCTNVSSNSSFLWNVQNWVRVQHARFNFFLIASKMGLIFYHKGKQHARVWSRVQSLVPYT